MLRQQELSQARNPDLQASFVAMKRAAELARLTALQSDMAIVVVEHGSLLRIPADQPSGAIKKARRIPSPNFGRALNATPRQH